jgi:hypothetical protein
VLDPVKARAFAADEVNDTRGSANRLCPQLPADP